MSRPTLVVISPQPAGAAAGLPTRPSSLIAAFIEAAAFDEVIIVNRLRPTAFLRRVTKRRPMFGGGLAALTGRLASGARLIEHPWPFGALERRFLNGVLGDVAKRSSGAVVAWVADPKSVSAVEGAGRDQRPWRVVADIYDAWDRSPLVRGDRRRRAVTDGYRAAAADADLVFANTTSMRDRLAVLGARDARLLPNACPPLDAGPAPRERAAGRPRLCRSDPRALRRRPRRRRRGGTPRHDHHDRRTRRARAGGLGDPRRAAQRPHPGPAGAPRGPRDDRSGRRADRAPRRR